MPIEDASMAQACIPQGEFSAEGPFAKHDAHDDGRWLHDCEEGGGIALIGLVDAFEAVPDMTERLIEPAAEKGAEKTIVNFIDKNHVIDGVYKKNIHDFYKKYNDQELLVSGGRTNALKILDSLSKYKDYEGERDTLTYNTTFLSTYLKFGFNNKV